jgi:Zn ribbon nucleic-acid-binding protein
VKRADRWCRVCKAPVAWALHGGDLYRVRRCVTCGTRTTRIKGQRKAKTMPARLYNHRVLVKQADALWTAAIHAKAEFNTCARCGFHKPLQAAHNVSRRVMRTRHDIDNGLPLCSGCHRLIDSDAEEKRSLFLDVLGQERYDRLQLMKLARGKTDLQLVILSLKQAAA